MSGADLSWRRFPSYRSLWIRIEDLHADLQKCPLEEVQRAATLRASIDESRALLARRASRYVLLAFAPVFAFSGLSFAVSIAFREESSFQGWALRLGAGISPILLSLYRMKFGGPLYGMGWNRLNPAPAKCCRAA